MTKLSKRKKSIEQRVDKERVYSISDALDLLKECPQVKFDQTVEIAIKLGVDPKKSDQQVRGTVSLPHGTGKKLRVLVFATGEKVQEAKDAGAEFVGLDELVDKINSGWTDFDAVVATPDTMRLVGRLGKVLGPRGLMPTPKAGTVTQDVSNAVKDLKAGRIEFKVDRQSVCSAGLGKISFTKEKLFENIKSFLNALHRAKPTTSKGVYMQSIALSSTMGPGLKIETKEIV